MNGPAKSAFVADPEPQRRLARALEEVDDDRRPRVVVVEGPGAERAGVLEAFVRTLGARHYLFCADAGEERAAPLALVRGVLARAFGIHAGDSAAAVASRLEEGVARFPGARDPWDTARRLGRVLGFDVPALELATQGSPGTGPDEAIAALTGFFAGVTRLRPAVIVLDAVELADPTSREVIEGLTRTELPLLWVLGASAPGPDGQSGAEPGAAAGAEPGGASGAAPASAAATATTATATATAATGAFEPWPDSGRTPLLRLELPPAKSAPASELAALLGALPDNERKVAQAAARAGVGFTDAELRAAVPESSGPEVPAVLSRLVTLGWLARSRSERFEASPSYRWLEEPVRAALAREAPERWTAVHAALARVWLERCHPDRLGELGGAVADHLDAADQSEQAVELRVRAGEHALRLKAFREAIAHFGRALPLARGVVRAQVCCRLGAARHGLGEFVLARRLLEESLGEAQAEGADEVRLEAMRLHARLLFDVGEYAAARTQMKAALGLARAVGDTRSEIYLLRQLGYLALAVGERHAARAWYSEALALAERSGSELEAALALNGLGETERMLKRYDLAGDYYRRALERLRHLQEPSHLPLPLGNLGVIDFLQGNFEEAERHQREALALARKLGNKWMTAHALEELGLVAVARAEVAQAARAFGEALTLDQETGATPRLLYALLGVARLALLGGDRTWAARITQVVLAHPARDWEIDVIAEPLLERLGKPAALEDAAAQLPELLREVTGVLAGLRGAS